ncbi:HMG box [Trichuris suis]|nr:HMG box [Trichuris suis]
MGQMESVPGTVISANGFQETGILSSDRHVRRYGPSRHRYKGVLPADRLRQMRSLNPFRLFLNEKRAKMKRKHPDLSARDIVSMIAAIWNGSPETDKLIYRAKVEKERRRVVESWGDKALLAYFDRKSSGPRKYGRPKKVGVPANLESSTGKAVGGNEEKVAVGETTSDLGGFRLPPSLANCSASRQGGHSLRRKSGPGRRNSSGVYGSVRELLEAARAKKARTEENSRSPQVKHERYLWDYESCLQGQNGVYNKMTPTGATSDTVSDSADNSHCRPVKDCFLPSFIAFDKKLDGEEHKLRLRDNHLRKQLTAVTEELADEKARDDQLKLSLNKNEQEVTDALLWTDFVYRVCLANALKSIRVPGFHSAVTTENVLEFLRAAANLVKEKNAKDRRFIGRFKSVMSKLTMPKAPC